MGTSTSKTRKLGLNLELPPIRHVTFIRVPPKRVYETLTSGEGWDAWFTAGTAVDPRPGGTITLRWRDFGPDHSTLEDGGPVLASDPARRFAFRWSPGDTPTTVDIRLSRCGRGTRVELTESGHAHSKKDLEALVGCAAGWGEALTLLKFFLEHGVTYGKVPHCAPTSG